MEEHDLIAAKRALHHHNADLELLFKAKHDAEVSGDTKYVQFAFDQINAVAKTIADGVESGKNLEQTIQSSKSNVELAETEILPNVQSTLRARKCRLLDAISEVGVFPQHVLSRLPERGAMETLCPYCSRVYILNAFVPLSCGCRYHPPCMRALILTGQVNCLACGARPHGTWMAYWGFPLDKEMSAQLEEHRARSMANEDWVEAAPDKVGSVVPFGPEPSTAATALIPYTQKMIENSSPSL